MDTDELSIETYQGIIIEAEKFNHDLTLQFGIIASFCENEEEYLAQSERLIKKIQKRDKDFLSEIFFGSPPDKEKLRLTLEKIAANISEIRKIPENRRHYDF